MNNDLMFSSKKDDWETPQDFFDELDRKYHFSTDLAATRQNSKCISYLGDFTNSLEDDWSKLLGNLWLNPPYGREIKKWVKKASETKLAKEQYLVMLIPARTDTSYWHDYIFDKAEIKLLRGRLKFEINGVPKDAAPFPSALVIFKGVTP